MTSLPTQNGILMNSQYTGRYRFFTGRNDENAVSSSSPPYVVPLTISILASQSIFLNRLYSPAATLIIPIYRTDVPYGYIFVIFMQAVTALLVKWAYAPSPLYMPLLGNYQALPDYEALKKISRLSQTPNNIKSNQGNKRTNRNLSLANGSNQNQVPSGPLLPEGIAINLSIISPFSDPTSRAASLFSIKLTLFKTNRGYIIPLVTLIIYFVLKPFMGTNNNKNNNNSNNSNKNNTSK